MKNALDLILERLEGMTNDEIVSATDYSDDINYWKYALNDCDMVYGSNLKKNDYDKFVLKGSHELNYFSMDIKKSFEYLVENKSIYKEKSSRKCTYIKPMAA